MAITNEQKEIIRKYYPILKPKEVAEMVNMKKENVVAYANRYGISNNRFWSEEEEEYLLKWYGMMSAGAIAEKLGKSYRNVIHKINHMKIGNFIDNTCDLNLAEVSRLVGKDKETIKRIWTKYGLVIRKKGKYSMIREKDLTCFMKNNPDRWNATKCESWYFERFEWFREKREQDREKMIQERWGG